MAIESRPLRTAFLGLGSNVNPEKNIRSAIKDLQQAFGDVGLSPVYRSAAHGFEGEDFINLAARIETAMAPLELKTWLGELENRHDRNRAAPRFSSRTLDVDILLYEDLYLLSPELEIPRAEILDAAWVLKPLADLAPDLIHPARKQSIRDLWLAFPRENAALQQIQLNLS